MSRAGHAAGDLFKDRFLLIRSIGRGGFGEVWEAEDHTFSERVALKLLLANAGDDHERRFLLEVKSLEAVKDVSCPNLVRIVDWWAGDEPYIAMELLSGETLRERLRRVGAVTPQVAARWIGDVAAGLSAVHDKGIIHRDVKPRNIFLAQGEGGVERAVLIDLGIVKMPLAPGEERTRTGILQGSFPYVSYDVLKHARDLDTRSDLWSLAVVAFELIAGKTPFSKESDVEQVVEILTDPIAAPSALAPEKGFPASIDRFFAWALQRDRSRRCQTADELAKGFAEAAADPSWEPPGDKTTVIDPSVSQPPPLPPQPTEPAPEPAKPAPPGPAPEPPRPRATLLRPLPVGLALLAIVAAVLVGRVILGSSGTPAAEASMSSAASGPPAETAATSPAAASSVRATESVPTRPQDSGTRPGVTAPLQPPVSTAPTPSPPRPSIKPAAVPAPSAVPAAKPTSAADLPIRRAEEKR